MPIYTKKGDKGETSLISKVKGEKRRVSKASQRVWTIGTLDELNSYLGVCVSYCESEEIINFVLDIQKNIFTINSILAGADLKFSAYQTKKLENKIDEIDKIIVPLSNFILPSGAKLSAHFQFARSLTRRAERELTDLHSQDKNVPLNIQKYVNRLSDMMFTLARYANHMAGVVEIGWKGSN